MSEDFKAFVRWLKEVSGVVQHEGKTSGFPDALVSDMVLNSIHRNHEDRRADTMKEDHGITRQPDSPNVLEVDFAHFRFVRDVRASVYGVRGSPLSTDVRTRR